MIIKAYFKINPNNPYNTFISFDTNTGRLLHSRGIFKHKFCQKKVGVHWKDVYLICHRHEESTSFYLIEETSDGWLAKRLDEEDILKILQDYYCDYDLI